MITLMSITVSPEEGQEQPSSPSGGEMASPGVGSECGSPVQAVGPQGNVESATSRQSPRATLDPGSGMLGAINRIQWLLMVPGVLVWSFRGRNAVFAFTVGSLVSIAFWSLHRIIVAKMLTPKVRLRWFYGFLTLVKLALIVVCLRGMMVIVPQEGFPMATGLMLFVVAILLVAGWQAVTSFRTPRPPPD